MALGCFCRQGTETEVLKNLLKGSIEMRVENVLGIEFWSTVEMKHRMCLQGKLDCLFSPGKNI